jgi:hypothetical protein
MEKFKSLDLARSYADRCKKIHLIIKGDDGRYWVGLPRITEPLYKQGFRYVK